MGKSIESSTACHHSYPPLFYIKKVNKGKVNINEGSIIYIHAAYNYFE
jgi:hypothetical protein